MKINTLLVKFVFIFYVVSVFLSCKEKEIIPEPPDNDSFYFIATVNDKSKNLVSGRNGYRLEVATQEVPSSNPDVINLLYTSGLSQLNNDYYIKSSEAATVIFDNNWTEQSTYMADPQTFFDAVYATGSRIFCSQTDSATPCIEIIWKDTYSKEWKSRTGGQGGSTFNITSVNASTGSSGESLKMVKATFNCNLYNEMGTSIILKNGQLFLIFKRA